MADYPSSITSLFSDVSSGQIVDVSHVNRIKEEIIAIQTELGADPAGGYTSLKDNIILSNRDVLTSVDDSDLIGVYDSSGGKNKAITFTNFKARSILRLHTFSGVGSTNTRIPYFSTVVTDVDPNSDFSYSNSSTNGLSITISKAGTYAITYCRNGGGASEGGISLNSSQLTTNIGSISASDRLSIGYNGIAEPFTVSWVGVLSSSDVIRPHIDGTTSGTVSKENFTIARVS